jgi:tRNA threonylcarbamoyladenosine biosynthesis protein TsaB
MATLCIDTATADGMVVVAHGDQPSATVQWRSAGRHGEHLFGHIETAMAKAQVSRDALSLIGVSIGPGGFTSLRVGLATAKGLALGLGLPIVGVSSLRVLARSLEGDPSLGRAPLMNAYRGDIFAAAFALEGEILSELVSPFFGPPEDVMQDLREALGDRAVAVCGEGVAPNRETIERVLGVSSTEQALRSASARPEALLAEVRQAYTLEGPADLARLEPRYLRPSDAKLPSKPLRTDHTA